MTILVAQKQKNTETNHIVSSEEMTVKAGNIIKQLTKSASNPTEKIFSEDNEVIPKPVIVKCRVVFTNLGLIETKTERYSANLNIESSWDDDVLYYILSSCSKNKRTFNYLYISVRITY